MPRCGATFDEKSVPLDKGRLQGVLGVTHNLVWVDDRVTHPGASRHPSDGGDFHRSSQPEFQRAGKRFLGIFNAIEPATVTTSYSPW